MSQFLNVTRCPQKLADLMAKCWAPQPEARPSFQEVQVMLLEIQEELKTIASATEVPKEAGQSLSSRAAPPAAKPAPIIGVFFVIALATLSPSAALPCLSFGTTPCSLTFLSAQAPVAMRPKGSGQAYPLISGGFVGG
jgi:hypothetical protein